MPGTDERPRDDSKLLEGGLVLRFSHNVIEHLGLRSYQSKPTTVLAELVSNSWDAEAGRVWILLRTTGSGEPGSVIVANDGVGTRESGTAAAGSQVSIARLRQH